MGLGFAGMTEYGFKGQKGDRGESFHVDKFGPLDDAQVRSIESNTAVDENDVYVFVVTSDTRALKPLDGVTHPDTSEPDDPTDTNKKVDTSRHVLMYNGRTWHDFGQFTGMKGDPGEQGVVDEETLARLARLESPKFEGTPEAPTKDATDSQGTHAQIATVDHVDNKIKSCAILTDETTAQTVKSHILTEKAFADFSRDHELVSKEYVDNSVTDTFAGLTDTPPALGGLTNPIFLPFPWRPFLTHNGTAIEWGSTPDYQLKQNGCTYDSATKQIRLLQGWELNGAGMQTEVQVTLPDFALVSQIPTVPSYDVDGLVYDAATRKLTITQRNGSSFTMANGLPASTISSVSAADSPGTPAGYDITVTMADSTSRTGTLNIARLPSTQPANKSVLMSSGGSAPGQTEWNESIHVAVDDVVISPPGDVRLTPRGVTPTVYLGRDDETYKTFTFQSSASVSTGGYTSRCIGATSFAGKSGSNVVDYAHDAALIGSTSPDYGYRILSTLKNGAMTPMLRIGAISDHYTENSSLYVDAGNIELGQGHALQFGDGTTLSTFPNRAANKYLETDADGLMSWGNGTMLNEVKYDRGQKTVDYTFSSSATYTANAPHILDLNGVSDSFDGHTNHTCYVHGSGIDYHDMTMVDRPAAAVTGQVSLRASDNNISTYSLKTLKAGEGIYITTPEDENCLQIGGVTSAENEIITIDPVTGRMTFPSINIGTHVNTVVGYNAGQGGALARTALYGRDAGCNGGNLDRVCYIGWTAGKDAVDARCSTYIGSEAGVNSRGEHTTAVGQRAGCCHDTASAAGARNTYLGSECGENHTSGSNCLFVGSGAGKGSSGDRNIYIGTNTGSSGTESDRFALGSRNIPLIEGTMQDTARQQAFKINAGHIEVDVDSIPEEYHPDFPNRVWTDGKFLRVGPP